MKFAVTFALALAVASTAQAKLTPHDDGQLAKEAATAAPDVESLYTGPAAAQLESTYFKAPTGDGAYAAGRCTVQTFVFTKMRLADACY